MANAIEIPLGLIDIPDRLREVDLDRARVLAASMTDVGQLEPIVVRPVGSRYALIIGRHRLEACHIAGFPLARAEVRDVDALTARMMEIDENLFRHELSPLDRAVFIAERKRIYEELHPETKAGVAGGRARAAAKITTASFSAETARRTGLADRTIRRAANIAASLAPGLRKRLSGTPLAQSEGELYRLSRLEPAIQQQVVDLILSGGAQRVTDAIETLSGRTVAPPDPAERVYQRLMDLWARAPKVARDRFLSTVGGE